jgi:transcription antitermination factor NusA-like protein
LAKSKVFIKACVEYGGDEQLEQEVLDKLRQMLGVKIDRVEEQQGELLVYVPKGQAAKAIGAGGSVVRSTELVLNKKVKIKELG